MKLILTQTVKNLGKKGDFIDVKDGYGRNFLLKNHLAVMPGDLEAHEIHKVQNEQNTRDKQHRNELDDIAANIANKKFVFKEKADNKGKLYGSIGPKEIAAEIGIEEKYIHAHYKEIGSYKLDLNINNHKVSVQIEILAK